MVDCKACGAWFATTIKTDLCPTCERALTRLGKYAAPVKHGRWVDFNGDPVAWDKRNPGCPEKWCFCSECGEELPASYRDTVRGHYCPSCGAKMYGGAHD